MDVNIETLRPIARDVRRSVLKMTHRAKTSHVGSALSVADILVYVYGAIVDRQKPLSERHRFLLSKGHACAALYATLAEFGYISREQLLDYAKDGSPLMAHASHTVPGVEFSTGSLGHALPVGAGLAYALSRRGPRPRRVYVLMSDGELNEGSNWEAMMLAAQFGLSNLVAIIDRNGLQGMGSTGDIIAMRGLPERFRSFGWFACNVDGHDFKALRRAFAAAARSRRPAAIIADTVKGKGVSFMEGQVAWHYRSPNDDELASALKELEGSDA